jgi:NAD(P)-dependent dehydrogenase (short-subunit alcohol dehydrogenase family)
MALRLQDKVCIITGGTSGIGQRTAEVFVAEGATVVIAGRREDAGQAIAGRLGARCAFVRTDVTDESQVSALVQFAVDRHGRIDCLFNNAGGPAPTGPIDGIPVAGFDAAIAVLLRSVMLGMKHVAPVMRRQGSGSIINNGSVAAHRAGFSSSSIYSAAKAAVVQLTRCVAMELGEHRVRVNSISPGGIATGIFGKAAGMPPEMAEQTAAKAALALEKLQAIPRSGVTDDVAAAAVFLASDESTFINGHDLVVDGGLMAGKPWSEQQALLQRLRAAFG